MSDPFDSNLIRIIQEGETDADSPLSEELMSQIRENWEALTILGYYTGDARTASANPPDDATGVLTHAGAAFAVDEHNGRTVVIIDGNGAGGIYTIDDTAAQTVTCTGDNLFSDGVRSGDAFKVFYNIKNTTAHTHDDVDSPSVSLSDGKVMLPPIMSELETAVTDGTNALDISWYDMNAGTALLKWKVFVPASAKSLRMWVRAARFGGDSNLDVRFTLDGNASTDTGVALGAAYAEYELTLDVGALSLAPDFYDLIIQEETGNDANEYIKIQGFSFAWEN